MFRGLIFQFNSSISFLSSLANTSYYFSAILKMASMTLNSVAVVSIPQNAVVSLATKPAPTTSVPLFTVPAQRGT